MHEPNLYLILKQIKFLVHSYKLAPPPISLPAPVHTASPFPSPSLRLSVFSSLSCTNGVHSCSNLQHRCWTETRDQRGGWMVETKNTPKNKTPLNWTKCRPLGGYTLSKAQRKTTQKIPLQNANEQGVSEHSTPCVGSTDVPHRSNHAGKGGRRERKEKSTDGNKTHSVGSTDGCVGRIT